MWQHALLSQQSKKLNIFLWAGSRQLAETLARILRDADYLLANVSDSQMVCVAGADLEKLLAVLDDRLSQAEKRGIKALMSEHMRPQLSEFGAIIPLEDLCMRKSARWLNDLLIERRYRSLLQRIVHAEDDEKTFGYEALIRGFMPDGREIRPDLLFDTAENADLVFVLDLAAIECSLETASANRLSEKIFINVLPRTLLLKEGLESLLATISLYEGISTDQVVLEVVESEELADLDRMRDARAVLADKGVTLAIDDFGSGFNSLSLLSDMQPDYLKLDRLLINGITTDAHKWNLVANIVDAAKSAGIKVIAEGVEDEETASALRPMGLDYMQGYLYGYPRIYEPARG